MNGSEINFSFLGKHNRLQQLSNSFFIAGGIFLVLAIFGTTLFGDNNESSLNMFEFIIIVGVFGNVGLGFLFTILSNKAKEIFVFSIFNVAAKEYFYTTEFSKLNNKDLFNSFLPDGFKFLENDETNELSTYNSPYKLIIDETFIRIYTLSEVIRDNDNRNRTYRTSINKKNIIVGGGFDVRTKNVEYFEHHWIFVKIDEGHKVFYEKYDVTRQNPRLLTKYEVNEELKKISQ